MHLQAGSLTAQMEAAPGAQTDRLRIFQAAVCACHRSSSSGRISQVSPDPCQCLRFHCCHAWDCKSWLKWQPGPAAQLQSCTHPNLETSSPPDFEIRRWKRCCFLQIAAKFGAALPDCDFVDLMEHCLSDLPDNAHGLALALQLGETVVGAERGAAFQQLAFDALLRAATRSSPYPCLHLGQRSGVLSVEFLE